jgi:hypothetical protein
MKQVSKDWLVDLAIAAGTFWAVMAVVALIYAVFRIVFTTA